MWHPTLLLVDCRFGTFYICYGMNSNSQLCPDLTHFLQDFLVIILGLRFRNIWVCSTVIPERVHINSDFVRVYMFVCVYRQLSIPFHSFTFLHSFCISHIEC